MGAKRASFPALSGDGRLKTVLECGDGTERLRKSRSEMMKCEQVGLTVGFARRRNQKTKPRPDMGREIAPSGNPPIGGADRDVPCRNKPRSMGGPTRRNRPYQIKEFEGSQ
jgi:hypothetical protein